MSVLRERPEYVLDSSGPRGLRLRVGEMKYECGKYKERTDLVLDDDRQKRQIASPELEAIR